jgi:hypothetical protein
MAKFNYRELAEDPDFDLGEFLRQLAFPDPQPTVDGPHTMPISVKVQGKKTVVTACDWERSTIDPRCSAVAIEFLAMEPQ